MKTRQNKSRRGGNEEPGHQAGGVAPSHFTMARNTICIKVSPNIRLLLTQLYGSILLLTEALNRAFVHKKKLKTVYLEYENKQKCKHAKIHKKHTYVPTKTKPQACDWARNRTRAVRKSLRLDYSGRNSIQSSFRGGNVKEVGVVSCPGVFRD